MWYSCPGETVQRFQSLFEKPRLDVYLVKMGTLLYEAKFEDAGEPCKALPFWETHVRFIGLVVKQGPPYEPPPHLTRYFQ